MARNVGVLVELVVSERGLGHRRFDEAGTDTVDPDAPPGGTGRRVRPAIIRVRRVTGQFLQPILDKVLTPLFDLSCQVEFFGMSAKILDNICLVDIRLVGTELPEERSDFGIVLEPVSIEKVEYDSRVECSRLFASTKGWFATSSQRR